MTDALVQGRVGRVVELAVPVPVVVADSPIVEVERQLRADPSLLGVAVRDAAVWFWVSRGDLDLQLTGRLGFGRHLLHRGLIRDLAGLPALVLDANTSADQAAELALTRRTATRGDAVLVRLSTGAVAAAPIERLVEHLAARYAQLAHTDALTGLGNRHALARVATRALQDPDGPVALFLLDLNRFKDVNDALGHDAGDELLRQVGAALDRRLRGTAEVIRLGGDEFAALIADFDRSLPPHVARLPHAEQLAWVGSRMLAEVNGPFVIAGVPVSVEGSIGIACAPRHGADLATLLSRADIAMYAAKRSRTGVQVWQPELTAPRSDDLVIVTELRDAIPAGQLRLHYQPLVEAATGVTRGVEALVRWQHPDRGLLYPRQFVGRAEDSDVILPMTNWVLTEAIKQAAAWHTAGRPLSVSVNVAAPALARDRVVNDIAALLESTELPGHLLTVEITESAIMTEPTRVAGRLAALRRHGVRVSIDDFGTGYTSLALLTQLPVDELKLDGTFTSRLHTPAGSAVVESVALLGRGLGLTLVGEGVEDQHTADILHRHGFHLLQGYHLGRPEPAQSMHERWTSPDTPRPPEPGPPRATAAGRSTQNAQPDARQSGN